MNDAILTKYWDILRRTQQSPPLVATSKDTLQDCTDYVIKQIQLQIINKQYNGRVGLYPCQIRVEPTDMRLLWQLQKAKGQQCDFGLDSCTQEVVWQKK